MPFFTSGMKKILVVDDDQFFPKTLAGALPVEKYTLIHAPDGEVGLEMLKNEKPDLVILDMMMPKVDGVAFLEKVNNSDLYPKTPILVSSNLSSVKKISDVMTMGVVGYVIKSDESLDSIVQDIERILGDK